MALFDSSTSALVRLALDAASMRHAAIANNIANHASPGYAPQRVNFEQQLGQARQALAAGGRVQLSDFSQVRPTVERGVPRTDSASGSASQLDIEMVRLAQNTLQYQALLRASGRFGTILATAINEGKR